MISRTGLNDYQQLRENSIKINKKDVMTVWVKLRDWKIILCCMEADRDLIWLNLRN